jgi:uncharacterized protein (DUF362 family)/Pyruvate/2-oxoacid:ferredoxin oxidoreductase delta subunit
MKVVISQCVDYSVCRNAVKKALVPLGGMRRFVKRGDHVLLKPNVLFGAPPERAVDTHPLFVQAVIEEVKAAGGIPSVGDSPGQQSMAKGANASGLAQVCALTKVPLIELDQPVIVHGAHIKDLRISGRLKNFDVLINLPKLKTHLLIGYTGAVKNLFGCVPGRTKSGYHIRFADPQRFSEMLLDLADIIQPQISIMDAIIGMEGMGPASGTPRQIGLVIASASPVALDTVACAVVGFSADDVATHNEALRRKHPDAFMDSLEIIGPSLAEVSIEHFKKARLLRMPKAFRTLTKRLFIARPICVATHCIGCARCRDICPVKAITMVDARPLFDYKKCIRCYCCHEICPEKAIDVRPGAIARASQRFLR